MRLIEKIKEHYRQHHEEERRLQEEFRKEHEEFHKRVRELHQHRAECHHHRAEFHHYHRRIRRTRLFIIVFNLLIWYLLFKFGGIKVLSVFLAILLSMGGLFEFFFLRRIQKRILHPIDKLKKGVEEIARGNYNIKVESSVTNEIKLLIDAFNEMAEKLQESERLKTEYEENRKMLIANISHDLKTPITSIQGYIEAITDGNIVSQENINKYLKIIYSNSSYINKLVDDLFLFSKLDMQKLEFQFIQVQVKPFFKDIMEEFKLELEENQIEFIYSDKVENDYNVNIDTKRMHQVLRNIIGNAVKYGPLQNLLLTTELYMKNDYVCIDIKDNGPGISEEKLAHIFDRFYRIDTERTKDFMSTGLGLAIAKELVEAHNGSITATSVENGGTCFTIMLPTVS